MSGTVELVGLDGGNPLGMLAALGVLQVLEWEKGPEHARMRWVRSESDGHWFPVVSGVDEGDLVELLDHHFEGLRQPLGGVEAARVRAALGRLEQEYLEKKAKLKTTVERSERTKALATAKKEHEAASGLLELELAAIERAAAKTGPFHRFHPVIKVPPADYRSLAEARIQAAAQAASDVNLCMLASFASDGVTETKENVVTVTPTRFSLSSGSKQVLKDFCKLLVESPRAAVRQALLVHPWPLATQATSLRWDPREMRSKAYMAAAPEDTPVFLEPAAYCLALLGLGMLPSFPRNRGLRTAGFGWRDDAWTWCLWEDPLQAPTLRTLLGGSELATESPSGGWRRARGVSQVFRCRRVLLDKNLYFSPAREL